MIAVDPSVGALEELLRLAHEAKANGIMYLVGDAEVLPLPDASIDAAVLRSVLVHVADPELAVDGARARAAPGRAAVAARAAEPRRRRTSRPRSTGRRSATLGARVTALWEERRAADPLQRLDADALEAALARAGFVEIVAAVEDPGEEWLVTEESVDARLDARGGPAQPSLRERWQAAFSAGRGRRPRRRTWRPRRARRSRFRRPQLFLSARRLSRRLRKSALPPRTRHRRARIRPIPSLQGPSRPPWGDACRRERDTVRRRRPDWLPRRALVLGLGALGAGGGARARAARGGGASRPTGRADADAGRLAAAGVEVRLGSEEESLLEGVELVVKSPGVPAESPLAAAARARAIPIWSEVELGYRLLPGNPLIGVTGTNGKTTTTELLGAILRAAGRQVEVAGNVGRALTDVAEQIEPGTTVVCELSSFQLEDVHTLACDVAVLLNLEPDHLDRHGTFEAYRDAKLRIFERARAKIVPRGLGLDGIEFAADDPLPAEPLIPGAHNRENAAAATAAARAAGVGDDAIAEALRTFAGVPHRLELVRELRRRPLRQRLEGDEHRRRAARRRRVRRAAAR